MSVETPNENTEQVAEPYLSPIIDDGYTRVSTIPGRPGVWSPVRLRWRKLNADQTSAIAARSVIEAGQGQCKHYAAELAGAKPGTGNVIDWDIKGKDGQKLPVTAEAIKGCDYEFYSLLVAVCEGEKPEWEEPARGSDGKAEAELKNLLPGSGKPS